MIAVIIVSFFLQESYVAVVSVSSGGDVVGYIPLLPGEQTFRRHFFDLQEMRFCGYGCSLYKPLNFNLKMVKQPVLAFSALAKYFYCS